MRGRKLPNRKTELTTATVTSTTASLIERTRDHPTVATAISTG